MFIYFKVCTLRALNETWCILGQVTDKDEVPHFNDLKFAFLTFPFPLIGFDLFGDYLGVQKQNNACVYSSGKTCHSILFLFSFN